MNLRTCGKHRKAVGGMALIDCLTYIAVLALILGMSFAAFYRVLENSKNLTRNAADLARTLRAGERWRDEVRSAVRPPRLETREGAALLRLPQAQDEIVYAFRDEKVFRQSSPATNWVEILPAVTASVMRSERRQHVTTWHWDVELQGHQKVARVKPVFSFQAVANRLPVP